MLHQTCLQFFGPPSDTHIVAKDRLYSRTWMRRLHGICLAVPGIGFAVALTVPSANLIAPAIATLIAICIETCVFIARLRLKRGLQKNTTIQLRQIVESATDAYIQLDQNGAVVGFNDTAATLFGYGSSSEFGGVRFGEACIASHCQEDYSSTLEAINESSDHPRVELWAKRPNGDSFPIELTAWKYSASSGNHYYLVIKDISLRKQAEEQLRRALIEERKAVQRLEELDRVKKDFVSAISHELRSPLTSTLGYLEMLSDGTAGQLTEEQAQMVTIAERNGKRLLALIEDVLTLSSIETGSFRVAYKPIPVRELIEDLTRNWRQVAESQSVDLIVNISPDELGVLPGEENQILRALGNVISNAIKFTPPQGKVTISAHREGAKFVLTITDTGIGIPFEEQPQLFKRFFRSTTAAENSYGGTGLGLTIARAIVEHHGGSITVTSRVGAGTTATISLPSVPTNSSVLS